MKKPLPLVTQNEIDALCECMTQSTGAFVELGTRWGGTAVWIAERFPDRQVVTVDIKKQYDDATFADLPNVTCFEADSQLGPEGFIPLIGVLFVDAKHTPAAVELDINKWSPYIERCGFLVVHDAVLTGDISIAVAGVQLVHKNDKGDLESGYPAIGSMAKALLQKDWDCINTVDSTLIFRRKLCKN